MPSPSIELSAEAYCVAFLHACKHPTKAVNGLLLGSAGAGGTKVVKALPLFHSSLALAPMLEAALMLADEHCKAAGLQLVGYYQANELTDDLDLGPFGKKIAAKIRAQCAGAAVLLLDGGRMRPAPNDLRLLCIDTDGKASGSGSLSLREESKTLRDLDDYLARGVQNGLVDFDTHLDDASSDWFNTKLLA